MCTTGVHVIKHVHVSLAVGTAQRGGKGRVEVYLFGEALLPQLRWEEGGGVGGGLFQSGTSVAWPKLYGMKFISAREKGTLQLVFCSRVAVGLIVKC